MIINSLSAGAIATSVWAQVTRTLSADPATDAGAATLVWAHSGRQLTSMVAGRTQVLVNAGSIANGATVDLRPAAGKYRHISVMLFSQANYGISTYDGVTVATLMTVTSIYHCVMGDTSGWALKNTSGGAQPYMYAGYDES